MKRNKRKAKAKGVQMNRNMIAYNMIVRTGGHAGPHKNRERAVKKGASRKEKHKGRDRE